MKRAIILFTRVPAAGKTKTRMMPHLTPGQCAMLHACFLRDIAAECRKCGADLIVSYTPDGGAERLRKILGRQMEYVPQKGENLGERMFNAISETLLRGYDACLLVGTDVPELRENHLKKAFWVLQDKDTAFGKTADGGYYLIGMKQPLKEAFGLDAYGHERVFEETLRALGDAGLTAGFTDTLYDMDTVQDLRGLRSRMRRDETLRRSHTGRFLEKTARISIIVPVYNERKTIEAIQKQLWPLKEQCEILFVDGGSTDGTPGMVWPEFTLLSSEKGRARQMNLGAEKSSGDILFFLHCDSEIPKKPLEEIRRVMKNHRAGCFGIAFHSRNFFMFTCRVISNHRVKDRRVMFGDQGIFVERELFFEAGEFPELPIMEDYQFSLTLKAMGIKPGLAGKRIYTSDRRFQGGTIQKLRLMWRMNRLRKMYRDGTDIETIAELYRDVR